MVLIVTFNSFEDETQGVHGSDRGVSEQAFNSFEDETGRVAQTNTSVMPGQTFNSFEDETRVYDQGPKVMKIFFQFL